MCFFYDVCRVHFSKTTGRACDKNSEGLSVPGTQCTEQKHRLRPCVIIDMCHYKTRVPSHGHLLTNLDTVLHVFTNQIWINPLNDIASRLCFVLRCFAR